MPSVEGAVLFPADQHDPMFVELFERVLHLGLPAQDLRDVVPSGADVDGPGVDTGSGLRAGVPLVGMTEGGQAGDNGIGRRVDRDGTGHVDHED